MCLVWPSELLILLEGGDRRQRGPLGEGGALQQSKPRSQTGSEREGEGEGERERKRESKEEGEGEFNDSFSDFNSLP